MNNYYILFNSGSILMFADKSFEAMAAKLKVDFKLVESIGQVDVNKWVCTLLNSEIADRKATWAVRQKWSV